VAVGIAVTVTVLGACSGGRHATGQASTAGTVRNRAEIPVVAPHAGAATTTASVPSTTAPALGSTQADGSPGVTSPAVTSTAEAPTAVTSTAGASTAVTSPAVTSTATTMPTAATPATPACGPGDLEVAFDLQPHGGTQPADRTRVLVVVTNLSVEGCRLSGFAVIDAVEGGRRTPIPVRHIDQPGPPTAVEVPGGGSAFAGVEWTVTAGCPDVSALALALPGWGSALPVAVHVPGGSDQPLVICPAGVLIGPFAATSEGTVAFPDSVGAGT
jgi:hypothetical protein